MRILYGVVGEGMDHATRSRVILEHLLSQGHEQRIVVSGRAHAFLVGKLGQRADLDEPPPRRLETTAMGAWDGPDLPPHLLAALRIKVPRPTRQLQRRSSRVRGQPRDL
jgi:hypothetical protein